MSVRTPNISSALFASECIERAVTLTKKGSAVPSNQCPVCKGKAPKRSLNPSESAARLSALYENIVNEYAEAVGDEQYEKNPEFNYATTSVPLENLSQLYPYPEKPKEGTSSPILHLQSESQLSERVDTQEFNRLLEMNESIAAELAELDRKLADKPDLGINTLAALEEIEFPSTPDDFTLEVENIPPKPKKIKSSTYMAEKTTSKTREPVKPEAKVISRVKTIKSEAISTPVKQQVEVSITPVKAIKLTKSKKPTTPVTPKSIDSSFVSTSGLIDASLITLAKWSDQFSIKVLPELDDCNTLIVATDDQLIVQKRTMKYFEALLVPEKMSLISFKWIEACLKSKKLVPSEPFRIKGDQVSKKRKQSPSSQPHSLFASHRFYFYGSAFFQPPPDQLYKLIKLAGSEVIHDVEQLLTQAKSYKCMILVDASSQTDYETDAEIIKRFPILSATWILDCISCQRVLDYKDYLIL